ncbi:MAG: hypothetical protein IJV22_02285 [Bacteroidales bacterium]|nr:hypothetical protein [Bacteroidales bacterium]
MSNTFRERKDVEEGLLSEQEQAQQTEEARLENEQSNPQEQAAPRRRRIALSSILGGEVLSRQWLRRQIGLIALIVGFMLLLVTNRYHVEKLSREKIQAEEHIKFLREQRIQMQKDYQESVKISRMAHMLDSVGVGLIAGPPYEIDIDK